MDENATLAENIFDRRQRLMKTRSSAVADKPARCFVSLNILLSHSRSLKVIENGIIRNLGTVSFRIL